MHFFFGDLGCHQHGIENTKLHDHLTGFSELVRIDKSLEDDSIDGRCLLHVFKIDLSLLDCTAAPDDFFKRLPTDRHRLDWRRCMHSASYAGSRVDHVENCIEDEKS